MKMVKKNSYNEKIEIKYISFSINGIYIKSISIFSPKLFYMICVSS